MGTILVAARGLPLVQPLPRDDVVALDGLLPVQRRRLAMTRLSAKDWAAALAFGTAVFLGGMTLSFAEHLLRAAPAPPRPEPLEVYFSPKGGCTEAVVREVDRARDVILVQSYSFTSLPVADALVRAKARGVAVRVLLDRSDETAKGSQLPTLLDGKVEVNVDDRHAIAHNKVMVIDRTVVLTGSFNFTAAAELVNAENLLVVRNAALARRYADNWSAHAGHSRAPREHRPLKEPLP
jgi:phosphatidylserine/phosphatidylglycerophosphate/cardiolipin synthase-like enzyme